MRLKTKVMKKIIAGLCMASMLFSTGAMGVVTAAEPEDSKEPPVKYTVLLENSENGTVQFSDQEGAEKEFAPGDTVSLKLNADDGFAVNGILIKDADTDEEIMKEDSDNNIYTFNMPEANLKVSASFVKEKTDAESATTDAAEKETSKASAAEKKEDNSGTEETRNVTFHVSGDGKVIVTDYDGKETVVKGGEKTFKVPMWTYLHLEFDSEKPAAVTVTDQNGAQIEDSASYKDGQFKDVTVADLEKNVTVKFDSSKAVKKAVKAAMPAAASARSFSQPEVGDVFTGTCTITNMVGGNGHTVRSVTMGNFNGFLAGEGNFTGGCADHSAASPYIGQAYTYRYTVTSVDKASGRVTGTLYCTSVVNPTDGVTTDGNGNLLGYQRTQATAIVYRDYFGYAHLTKSSANTTITNENDCYSLAGATYGVYSDSGCTKQVGTLTTDANGTSNTLQLDAGSYYVKEITAPKGYYKDTNTYPITVVSGQTSEVKVSDVPGNDPAAITLNKIDAETGEAVAQGAASLAGAQFTINYYDGYYTEEDLPEEPTRTWVIETQEIENPSTGEVRYRAMLKEECKVAGDDFYYTEGNPDPTLPLGTITVEETKAPEGYKLDGSILYAVGSEEVIEGKYVSQITMDSDMVSLKGGNEYTVEDEIIRGDFEFTKVDSETQKAMAGVQFEITSNTTGESHIITTDENGYYSSAANFNKHTNDTNGGKADSGLWFGEGEPDDSTGAMLFDTYTIKEIEGKNNEGKVMYEGTLTVSRDGFTLDMGTIENIDQPSIGTTAKNEASDNHYALADEEVVIVDTIQYYGLTKGETYRAEGVLMDKETGKAVLDADGNPITAETEFKADTPAGTVDVEFVFDGSNMAGKDLVVFEELYAGTELVAEHKDIEDTDQTIHFPAIGTKAMDSDTETNVSKADEDITIVDTVEYKNLKPGYKFTVKGTLMDKETGEPVLDDNGKEITAETTFTPEKKDGTVEVTFHFSGVSLAGKTVVVFEQAERNDKVYAVHADIEDEAQTVTIPKISTSALDGETGIQNSYADGQITIVDTVSYENLIPGQEYTMIGKVMDKETGEVVMAKVAVNDTDQEEEGTPEEEKPEAAPVSKTDTEETETPEAGEDQNQPADDEVTDSKVEMTKDPQEVTGEATFVPEESDGTIDITFVFDGSEFAGKTFVVFEELMMDEKSVAAHEDLNDDGQTVYIPEIGTKASDKENGTQNSLADEEVTIVDKVSYENLIPGTTYEVSGKLYDKETGNPLLVDGKEVTATKEFTPEKASGTVELEFTFNGSALVGKTIVVFEDVLYEGKQVASHADIEDKDQSIYFPELGTTATDKEDGDKKATADNSVTILDRVEYSNLTPGVEYTISGTLMSKETGKALIINGSEVTAEKTFTPEKAKGYVNVEFTFDGTNLGGKDVVVFEKLYLDGKEVGHHEDINDEGQTVKLVTPPAGHASNKVQTGDTWYMIGAAFAAVVLIGGGVVLLRKKKGPKAE